MKVRITETRVYDIPGSSLDPGVREAIKQNDINALQDLLCDLSDLEPESIDVVKVEAQRNNARRSR